MWHTFIMALPYPSTICQWCRGVYDQPGFAETFAALSGVDEARSMCSVMFKEIAIRKLMKWDGKNFTGYVDVGSSLDDVSNLLASEALVIMLVCLNSNWKVPSGYLLIDGISGNQ